MFRWLFEMISLTGLRSVAVAKWHGIWYNYRMTQIQVSEEGRAIYDAIMGPIEPELLSQNLSQLQEIAAQDTETMRAERLRRYADAYATYENQYHAYRSKQQAEHLAHRRQDLQAREKDFIDLTGKVLEDLDHAIATLSPSGHDTHI